MVCSECHVVGGRTRLRGPLGLLMACVTNCCFCAACERARLNDSKGTVEAKALVYTSIAQRVSMNAGRHAIQRLGVFDFVLIFKWLSVCGKRRPNAKPSLSFISCSDSACVQRPAVVACPEGETKPHVCQSIGGLTPTNERALHRPQTHHAHAHCTWVGHRLPVDSRHPPVNDITTQLGTAAGRKLLLHRVFQDDPFHCQVTQRVTSYCLLVLFCFSLWRHHSSSYCSAHSWSMCPLVSLMEIT